MKKTLTILFFIALSIGAFGQTRARTGISIGDHKESGTNVTVIDSATIEGTDIKFFNGGDTLNPYVPVVNQTELFDVAMKLYPDSLFVTTVEFRPQLTHLNTYIRCNHATQTKVFLPPDSTVNFPIGSTLNFKNDGAGIVTFYESNSVITSKNDSASINVQNGWATAIKRAANKWDLLGDLQD